MGERLKVEVRVFKGPLTSEAKLVDETEATIEEEGTRINITGEREFIEIKEDSEKDLRIRYAFLDPTEEEKGFGVQPVDCEYPYSFLNRRIEIDRAGKDQGFIEIIKKKENFEENSDSF